MKPILFESDINPATAEYPFINKASRNITYAAHFHREVELLFVTEGSLLASNETEALLLQKGDFCLFLPGEIHSMRTETENCELLMKLYVPQSCKSLAERRLCCSRISPGDCAYPALREIVATILKEDAERQPGYQAAVALETAKLLLLLLRELKSAPILPEERTRLRNASALLETVLAYLSAHYREEITLEQIASCCGYSKYYFAHQFQKAASMSFMDYLALYRLEKAAAALSFSSDRIIDIAYEAGFRNIRSFNRLFQKYFHLTPSAYRTQVHHTQAERSLSR